MPHEQRQDVRQHRRSNPKRRSVGAEQREALGWAGLGAVTREQIIAWRLPSRPTKQTDTRAKAFGYRTSVELDAIEPNLGGGCGKCNSVCRGHSDPEDSPIPTRCPPSYPIDSQLPTAAARPVERCVPFCRAVHDRQPTPRALGDPRGKPFGSDTLGCEAGALAYQEDFVSETLGIGESGIAA